MENQGEKQIEYKLVDGVMSKVTNIVEPLDTETLPKESRLADVRFAIQQKETDIAESQQKIADNEVGLVLLREEERQLSNLCNTQ